VKKWLDFVLVLLKNEKGKLRKKDLPLLKNDIPNNLWPQKPVVYSRNQHPIVC